MMMIGQTISSLPIDLDYINYVKIENGIYEHLYVTHINESVKQPNQFVIPDKWDGETYLHAKFNGDLYSGNTDFGVENTTNLIIKRREKGTYRWMPLFDKPITSSTDFNFNEYDKYALAGVTYEYAAVPILHQHEGTYSIMECTPSFDCLVIMDKDETYSTIYDINISQQKNNTSSVIVPIQAKYPIYVANAYNDYYTGNISATFLNVSEHTPEPSIRETVKLRKKLLDFLNNQKVKYIKDPFGRCWMAVIGTTISDEDTGHPCAHKISFDFIETGNTESIEDLHRFGFLDIGKEWWI